MKRCPKCASSFPDTVRFCEFDGAQLTADYLNNDSDWSVAREEEITEPQDSAADALLPVEYSDSDQDVAVLPEEQPTPNTSPAEYPLPYDPRTTPARQNSHLLPIMLLAGVVIAGCVGLVVFIVYRMNTEAPAENSNEAASVAVTQPQAPLIPSHPTPAVDESPSPAPSPSASATPSPGFQADSVRTALSSTEVSTGGNEKSRRGPVTIQLTNGTIVEADEAWETGEGIWYRHRNVVTLLERNQVKAIEKPTPAPSPSATPTTSPGLIP